MYNQLGRHIATGSYKSDFWSSNNNSMRKKLLDFQKQWKARRAHVMKAPFHVPDSPAHVEKDIYIIPKKALQELVVDLKFDEKDLELYDSLNSDITFLKESCKSKALCKQFYDWLGYEMRFLIVCDAIAEYQSRPIDAAPAPAAAPAGAATPAALADDADEGDDTGDAGKDGEKRQDPHHFLAWDLNEIRSIPWNEMRFTEIKDSSECYSSWPACIAFFYITELPKSFPDVDGALHKLWLQSYASPMKAEDLDSTPIAFSKEETEWCKKTIESLQRGLTASQREERGLPVSRLRPARTKQSVQVAQAAKSKGAQDDVRQADAAEASDECDISPSLKTPRRCVCIYPMRNLHNMHYLLNMRNMRNLHNMQCIIMHYMCNMHNMRNMHYMRNMHNTHNMHYMRNMRNMRNLRNWLNLHSDYVLQQQEESWR